MTLDQDVRRPYLDPVVSAPIDALDATRVFGGLVGQVILSGGSAGNAMDDGDCTSSGDTCLFSPGPGEDSQGADGADPIGPAV